MSLPTTSEFLNQTTPPPPAGQQNIVFQSDGATPLQSITAYPQIATTAAVGAVKPDGVSIQIAPDGTLTANTSEDVAFIEAVQEQLYIFGQDTGTANAYAVAINPAPSIQIGSIVVVLFANANTGASTLAVNGGTPTAITKDGDVALTGGEINAGQILPLIYDGTNFQIIGSGGGGGGGGNPEQVVPSGAINGSNVTYILPIAAVPGTGSLYLNGVLQNPLGATPDYTLAGDGITITMAVAPVSSPTPDWLLFTYASGSTGSGPAGPPGPTGATGPAGPTDPNALLGTVGVVIDGGGSVPATGLKGFLQLPWPCTITGWSLIADQAGSASIDVWFVAGSAPPSAPSVPNSSNKISASAPAILSSAQSAAGGSSAISTWTVALTQYGTIAFNLSAATTVTRLTLILQVTKA